MAGNGRFFGSQPTICYLPTHCGPTNTMLINTMHGDKNKVLSPSDTCKTNQRKYQREMKVAPPFIKHCLHCLHCFDCLQFLSLPSQWHIHKCRPTYMMTLLTLLHSCMPYRFRSRKWDWLSGLQWSGWKTIMLRISISSMVFDIVGPLEARTSKFGGLSGARRRLPPAQPVKTTSGHCRVLRLYFVFLLQKSEELIFFTDKISHALGSDGCSIDWLFVTMLKNLKTALFQGLV